MDDNATSMDAAAAMLRPCTAAGASTVAAWLHRGTWEGCADSAYQVLNEERPGRGQAGALDQRSRGGGGGAALKPMAPPSSRPGWRGTPQCRARTNRPLSPSHLHRR